MDKVAIYKCATYEYKQVKEAVDSAVKAIGGLDSFIKPNMKVLLKCNLVMKKLPDAAATTHPAVVQAVAEVVKALGAIPIIGDSPGGPLTTWLLKNVYHGTGMAEVASKTGAELSYNIGVTSKAYPNGKICRKFDITSMVNDADVVISIGKFKTHGLTTFTGCVKNMFGAVPGTRKAEYHAIYTKLSDFGTVLVELCDCLKPQLSILDGIFGMEGEGPTGGKPRKVGAILASYNPHALDLVATSIIGLSSTDVCTLKAAIHMGLVDPKTIDVVGDSIADLGIVDYDIPKLHGGTALMGDLPFVGKMITRITKPKPVFYHEICTGCGACVRSCPVRAIELKQKRPYAELDKCIRCFCCQELCPQVAVKIHRPFVTRLLK